MKAKKLIIENLNSADKYLKETKANLLEMKRLIDCTKKIKEKNWKSMKIYCVHIKIFLK